MKPIALPETSNPHRSRYTKSILYMDGQVQVWLKKFISSWDTLNFFIPARQCLQFLQTILSSRHFLAFEPSQPTRKVAPFVSALIWSRPFALEDPVSCCAAAGIALGSWGHMGCCATARPLDWFANWIQEPSWSRIWFYALGRLFFWCMSDTNTGVMLGQGSV